MITYLLVVYLKLNVLLALAFLVWMLVKTCMRTLRVNVSSTNQLRLARYAVMSLLLGMPALLLSSLWVPGWLGALAYSLPGASQVDVLTVMGRLMT